MVIYKYPFEIKDKVLLDLPKGAKILRVAVQNETPCIWALVNADAPRELRGFRIYGTEHRIGPEAGAYVATFNQGPYVWHLFEQKQPIENT
jgi:hypothetical protein